MKGMKASIGKKIEMTQVFKDDGTVVPVTLVQAGPCIVIEVREYQDRKAVVVGFGNRNKIAKPQQKQWGDLGSFSHVCELGIPEGEELKRGDEINLSVFEQGDTVDAVGISKGKGFQGVVKRHRFKGGPASHGHKDQLRMPGSIGAGGPQHVFKGKKMPGRMGGERVTVKNLEIVQVNEKDGVLAIKGAIPGSRGSIIQIIGTQGSIWQK